MKRALILCLLLPACKLGPDYQSPKLKTRANWQTSLREGSNKDQKELQRWWTQYKDPALNALIDEALKNNLDLALAKERLNEARALTDLDESALYPSLEASASYSRQAFGKEANRAQSQRFGAGGGFGAQSSQFDIWQAGPSASWELDLFGRVRRLVEASTAEAEAVVEAWRGVMVSLLGDLVTSYFQLRAVSERVQVVERNLKLQQESLAIVEDRFRAGLGTELDVFKARTLLARTRASAPELRRQQAVLLNRLTLLLGRNQRLDWKGDKGSLPKPPTKVSTGIPAELLTRRPDLREAERRLAASTATIGAAKAERFPRLTLSGNFTFSARSAAELVGPGAYSWGLGPSLNIPLFDGGRVTAQVNAAESRQRQALLQLKGNLLRAVAEVEDALSGLNQGESRVKELEKAFKSARRSVDLSNDLFSAGAVNILTVIDAQRELISVEDELINARLAWLTESVKLYKALGGGWS